MNFLQYGFLPELLPANANGIPARITAVHRDRFALVSENGEGFGRLKTKEYYVQSQDFPTVGDFVLIRPVPGGDSQILRTLPRKSFFSRHDPAPNAGEQAVAANFDVVLLLPIAEPRLQPSPSRALSDARLAIRSLPRRRPDQSRSGTRCSQCGTPRTGYRYRHTCFRCERENRRGDRRAFFSLASGYHRCFSRFFRRREIQSRQRAGRRKYYGDKRNP